MSRARYEKDFYEGADTVSLARCLLGKKLVTRERGRETSGMIVEVEAYLGHDDPACHAARGMTDRNRVMFLSPGHCYVYLIYGMYHCVNVVSDPQGVGSAVLIRAVEPLSGLELMEHRRRKRRTTKVSQKDLARGPGRLCEAFGITRSMSGKHFGSASTIWIEPHKDFDRHDIVVSGRIGISAGADMPLRFFLRDNPWVSGR